MTRTSLERTAAARAKITRFLALHPDHELAEPLRDLMLGNAPPTREQAMPVMIDNANKAGGWTSDDRDEERAKEALGTEHPRGAFEQSVWAQWQTLVHFCGGMK